MTFWPPSKSTSMAATYEVLEPESICMLNCPWWNLKISSCSATKGVRPDTVLNFVESCKQARVSVISDLGIKVAYGQARLKVVRCCREIDVTTWKEIIQYSMTQLEANCCLFVSQKFRLI